MWVSGKVTDCPLKFARTKLVCMYFRTWDQTFAARPDSQRQRVAQHPGTSSSTGSELWCIHSASGPTGGQGSPLFVLHCLGQELLPHSLGAVRCSRTGLRQQRREGQSFLGGFWNANLHLQKKKEIIHSQSVTRHTKGGNATCGPQCTIFF